MLDLDKHRFEFECPECGFYNGASIRQARVRDVVICRGCKADIWLDDGMNECGKIVTSLRRSIRRLEREMGSQNLDIEIG